MRTSGSGTRSHGPTSQPRSLLPDPIDSADFLKEIGISYWRDFERRSYRDDSIFATVQDEFQPLTPAGRGLRAVIGTHGERTYVQHLGYRLSQTVYAVASSYLQSDPAPLCEVRFFMQRDTKENRFRPASVDKPSVQQALTEWRGRLAA